ncbi:MAG: ATP citrate lyase citrate-binding domain-containing protein, partial [Candidatus Korarchaeota archaeon]|nr:ATP citrate lyase citrate-binding domain-containing protein [Candidatus Korarchaeota archaeon]
LTDEGLVALDARIDLDDHALFRHPDVEVEVPKDLNREPTDLERRMWYWDDADPRGTGYFIQLTTEASEGYIGFHGIGGGGAMLAADALIRRGLKLANYSDTSGDPPASKVYRVIRTILSIPRIEGYVMMGSVLASQEQWHHAHAIVKAFNEMLRDRPGFPAVILLAGNKEEESHEIIRRGVRDLPIRFELYGRDYIYETDYIADRVLKLVEEYRRERNEVQD